MTRPEHLTHFWGPTGTTTPADRITVDLRPGGVFETVMRNDGDGSEYTMRATYHAIDPPAMLGWTEEGSGMITSISFVDLDGEQTEVITRLANVPAAYRAPEAQAGFATSLDRCAAYVAELAGNQARS